MVSRLHLFNETKMISVAPSTYSTEFDSFSRMSCASEITLPSTFLSNSHSSGPRIITSLLPAAKTNGRRRYKQNYLNAKNFQISINGFHPTYVVP